MPWEIKLDGVETGIWCRDCGNVADQVNARGVPPWDCKLSSGAPPAFVLTEVLRNIVQMAAVLTDFKFASTGIENACTLGQGSEDLLEPSLAVYFVDVFEEHSGFLVPLLGVCFCKSEQA